MARDLPATFEGEIAHGRLFLRTNLDAPTYRLYVVDPEQPAREGWREIIPPREGAVLEGARVAGDRLALSYLERASSRLRLCDLEGAGMVEVELPTLGSLFGTGAEWDGRELFFGFSSYAVLPSVYRIDLSRRTSEPCGSGSRPTWTQTASRCIRSRSGRGTARR